MGILPDQADHGAQELWTAEQLGMGPSSRLRPCRSRKLGHRTRQERGTSPTAQSTSTRCVLEPGRASGRFDAAYVSRRGERAGGLTDVKGDTAQAIAHRGGDRLDAEVVTALDGLKQRDAGGCDPQAGTAQLLEGGPARLFLLRYWSLPVPWLSTKPILQWTESKSRSAPNPYPAGTRTCVGTFGYPTEPE